MFYIQLWYYKPLYFFGDCMSNIIGNFVIVSSLSIFSVIATTVILNKKDDVAIGSSESAKENPVQIIDVEGINKYHGNETVIVNRLLTEKLKGIQIYKVIKDDVSGLYVVKLADGQILYTNNKVTYVIIQSQDKSNNSPQLISLENGNVTNVTANITKTINTSVISETPILAAYKAKNEKYIVTSFVDPACPYCKKMHDEVEDYNKLGITVNFAPYPIFGDLSMESLARLMSAPEEERKDKLVALEAHFATKRGQRPDWENLGLNQKTSEGKKQAKIGQLAAQVIGFTGTPGIVFPDGEIAHGYITPQKLKEILSK